MLTDTPGHAKLRNSAFERLSDTTNAPTGVIFVVDSSNLSSGGGGSSAIDDTAEYLHDVLLELQKLHARSKASTAREVPFLVASNKSDLFTSLPASAVKSTLEAEITKIRQTRARGIAAVGGMGKVEGLDAVDEEGQEQEPLGGSAEGKFEFRAMEDCNVYLFSCRRQCAR